MKEVDPNYDGTDEPVCDDTWGAVVLDSIVGGLALGVASVGVEEESSPVVVIGAVVGLAFAVSAIIGEQNVSSCKEAKAAWRIGGAIGRASQSKAHKPDIEERPIVVERKATPRGFFCATSEASPTAGTCARQKIDCSRARDAIASAVPDISVCAIVESAWCVQVSAGDDRCFPAVQLCELGSERIAASASCREVR